MYQVYRAVRGSKFWVPLLRDPVRDQEAKEVARVLARSRPEWQFAIGRDDRRKVRMEFVAQ